MKRGKSSLKYYSDWLLVFKKIKEANNFENYYEDLFNGDLKDRKFSLNLFIKELVDFINFEIHFYCNQLNTELNYIFEINEYDSFEILVTDFLYKCRRLSFYTNLKFIPTKIKNEITISLKEAVVSYLQQLKQAINKSNSMIQFELEYFIDKKIYKTEVEYV